MRRKSANSERQRNDRESFVSIEEDAETVAIAESGFVTRYHFGSDRHGNVRSTGVVRVRDPKGERKTCISFDSVCPQLHSDCQWLHCGEQVICFCGIKKEGFDPCKRRWQYLQASRGLAARQRAAITRNGSACYRR